MSTYVPKRATAVKHPDGRWWVHDEFGPLDGPYTARDAAAVAAILVDK